MYQAQTEVRIHLRARLRSSPYVYRKTANRTRQLYYKVLGPPYIGIVALVYCWSRPAAFYVFCLSDAAASLLICVKIKGRSPFEPLPKHLNEN